MHLSVRVAIDLPRTMTCNAHARTQSVLRVALSDSLPFVDDVRPQRSVAIW